METKELISQALSARENAYAPYSGFMVGAALLCKDGTVYTGCNIENAAFTPTNCAEKRLFSKQSVKGNGILCKNCDCWRKKGEMTAPAPCGVCLQVMSEFCKADEFEIVMAKSEEDYRSKRLSELLPSSFFL